MPLIYRRPRSATPRRCELGELVLAIGNPLGFTRTLITGIVHALGSARQWMQAKVLLAPGNSGGLLTNAQG